MKNYMIEGSIFEIDITKIETGKQTKDVHWNQN